MLSAVARLLYQGVSSMRVLFGYHYYPYPVDVRLETEALMARLRAAGHDVRAFPLTLRPPGPKVNWPDLDSYWRHGNRTLLTMYENLARELEDRDVFLNYGGLNLHPEFLRQLSVFTVMVHFDDPENSEVVSKPVAHAYDLCLVCNRAEVDRYFEWGAKRAAFVPIGFRQTDYDPSLTVEQVRAERRDIDLTLLCSREIPMRRARLDAIADAFPQGRFHGLGWPAGFLPEEERVPLLRRTKVGINVHHTTGPINVRLYALPANGVMQICDCKSFLGEIFEIGKEIVAYETTEEAIELCHYYLRHEDERREIAAAGFLRSVRDYSEEAVYRRTVELIQKAMAENSAAKTEEGPLALQSLQAHRRRTSLASLWHGASLALRQSVPLLWRSLGKVKRAFRKLGLGAGQPEKDVFDV